jgi:hypothetical protein
MVASKRVVTYVDNNTLEIIDLVANELGIHRSALLRGILVSWARKQQKIRDRWDKIVISAEDGVEVI